MPDLSTQGKSLRQLIFGTKVDRATATLPQTTNAPIFNVLGGRVLVTAIVGEVTTIIQNQANNTKLIGTPTVGTAVDLCAVTSIANKEVGCLLGITGVFSDALLAANAGGLQGITRDVIVPIGTINLSCAASNTGSIKWSIFYVPLDDGASITAA